ncbi:hypothetical protein WJX73_003492 [Symbiochloris irregularis]|uniref:Plastid division regulator MinE n=1 Tax=Symbiochloris irregularis TaxID=706552 RepID=A0AAW1P1D4_9CHLO
MHSQSLLRCKVRHGRRHLTISAAVAEKETVETYDVVTAARQKVTKPVTASPNVPAGAMTDFVRKLRLAWRIFFPEQQTNLSAKDEGKNRLRMILVADRCGMNQTSLYEMKQSIVNVVSDYVDLEAEELVEVNISMDVALGTVYSVAMPVKRVKPQARLPGTAEDSDGSETADGITMEWDDDNPDSDPSAQFPYGC